MTSEDNKLPLEPCVAKADVESMVLREYDPGPGFPNVGL